MSYVTRLMMRRFYAGILRTSEPHHFRYSDSRSRLFCAVSIAPAFSPFTRHAAVFRVRNTPEWRTDDRAIQRNQRHVASAIYSGLAARHVLLRGGTNDDR